MATLYGTTADGESLPVQVNEFGQLVAQGLQGPPGEQGEQGEQGPVGNVEFTSGEFLPVFSSSDPSGSGFLEYEKQFGYWYRFGPLLTVQFQLRTSSVGLTDIRGYLEVSGLPSEAHFATPSPASAITCYTIAFLSTSARGNSVHGRMYYEPERQSFRVRGYYDGELEQCLWADLDSPVGEPNIFVGSFSGLAADAVRSVPIALDDLM